MEIIDKSSPFHLDIINQQRGTQHLGVIPSKGKPDVDKISLDFYTARNPSILYF